MSKKRPSAESSTGEQTNSEGSVATTAFQQDENAKRLKLTPLSDTTLQDLPRELIECIFIKAIAMEVSEMHLDKSVWKDKAELVMSRLGTVCPDWSNILTANFFQNELYRTLDRTAPKAIRLDILKQSHLPCWNVYEVIPFKDELFVLHESNRDRAINVYDCDSLAVVKDTIDLSEFRASSMAACSVSNCLYIFNSGWGSATVVYRIAKIAEHQFSISPFISCKAKSTGVFFAGNGNIIVLHRCDKSTSFAVYDANGSLQYTIVKFSSDLPLCRKVIARKNGNLVLLSSDGQSGTQLLSEMDTKGTILRRFQSSLSYPEVVCLGDPTGRILLVEMFERIELLDHDLNPMNVIGPQLDLVQLATGRTYFSKLHYNGERNELVAFREEDRPVLCTLVFTEE